MKQPKAKCSAPGCESEARAKGRCSRCYMADYNRSYYAENRVEILAHIKQYRQTKPGI